MPFLSSPHKIVPHDFTDSRPQHPHVHHRYTRNVIKHTPSALFPGDDGWGAAPPSMGCASRRGAVTGATLHQPRDDVVMDASATTPSARSSADRKAARMKAKQAIRARQMPSTANPAPTSLRHGSLRTTTSPPPTSERYFLLQHLVRPLSQPCTAMSDPLSSPH